MDRSKLFTRYSELVLRHERMIRTLCLRQTDDAELLKDLAHEVRIGLWERYLESGGNLGVWPEGLWVYWQTPGPRRRGAPRQHSSWQRRQLR